MSYSADETQNPYTDAKLAALHRREHVLYSRADLEAVADEFTSHEWARIHPIVVGNLLMTALLLTHRLEAETQGDEVLRLLHEVTRLEHWPKTGNRYKVERDQALSAKAAMRGALEKIEQITRGPSDGVDESETMDDHRRDLFHAWHAASTALSAPPTGEAAQNVLWVNVHPEHSWFFGRCFSNRQQADDNPLHEGNGIPRVACVPVPWFHGQGLDASAPTEMLPAPTPSPSERVEKLTDMLRDASSLLRENAVSFEREGHLSQASQCMEAVRFADALLSDTEGR